MSTNIENERSIEEQFADDCKVINLRYEYPGFIGEPKWAVISHLTEREILERYPEQIAAHTPFIVLDSEVREIRRDYIRNEKKYAYRQNNCEDSYGYDEGVSEAFHAELTTPDYITQKFEIENLQLRNQRLYKALSMLTEPQRRRLILSCIYKIPERDIAEKEGKSKTSIHESLVSAIKNFKKFYETPDQNGSATGN